MFTFTKGNFKCEMYLWHGCTVSLVRMLKNTCTNGCIINSYRITVISVVVEITFPVLTRTDITHIHITHISNSLLQKAKQQIKYDMSVMTSTTKTQHHTHERLCNFSHQWLYSSSLTPHCKIIRQNKRKP